MSFISRTITTCILLCLIVPHLAAQGTKHALLIGVSKYDPKQLHNLPFAEKDVTDLAKVLIEKAKFPKDNVRILSHSQTLKTSDFKWLPNAKSIRRELRLLTGRAEKNDTVLIAFAGHGIQFSKESENYFCPSDADLANRKTLIGLKSEVYALLEKECKARVKLLFVDACRNDPRTKGARRKSIDIRSLNSPQELKLPKGIAAFFSCKAGEESFESKELGHGVFFHYVIEGLKGKAASSRGEVTLPGLRLFVRRNVITHVDREFNGVQTPDLQERSDDVITLVGPQSGIPKGFVSLFNGKDLTGWHGLRECDYRKFKALSRNQQLEVLKTDTTNFKEHWSVENGELVNKGRGTYATTDKEYTDYELLIEYKAEPRADSGIYLRATPQVQIWDTTRAGGKWRFGSDKGSGGLYNNLRGADGRDPLVHADRPLGEWNQLRIIQVGARTTVYLNEKLVVDHAIMDNYWNRKLPVIRQGPIQLQTFSGEMRWRNLYIREIGSEEANTILSRNHSEGFKSIFNKRNLEGWAGATDNYKVVNGNLLCKKGKGGVLFTREIYSDFVARLEFQLPPGGNNGLAIRYPGRGQASVDAMCELQILDNTAAKYARLDPRQYHGSVYGMVPAVRGYLRPVGQWNFQEVTVKGSTIKVELNGSVIVNADVSKVTTFMGNKRHPGKDLEKGHFGFAGHNDPVKFRNIQIKRLK